MEKYFKKLFCLVAEADIPSEKKVLLLTAIALHRERAIRLRLGFLWAVTSGSLAAIVFSVIFLERSLVASGFFSYVSLAFSDTSTLFSFWKEFTFSILESLPLLSVAALFAAVAIFIWSGTKALRDSRTRFLAA